MYGRYSVDIPLITCFYTEAEYIRDIYGILIINS